MGTTRISVAHEGAPMQHIETSGHVFAHRGATFGPDEAYCVRRPDGTYMVDTTREVESDAASMAEMITGRHWLLLDREGFKVERVRLFRVL